MNQEKISKLIKDIRTKNNLTQNEFAKKYNVTYQAVSKWENGKNLPDISILKEICNENNLSLDEFLDNNVNNKKKNYILVIIIIGILILIGGIIIYIKSIDNNFRLKPITASCEEYKVSGSIAYNKDTASIYISDITYCGEEKEEVYDKLNCTLIEVDVDVRKVIDTKSINNSKLSDIANNINFHIDNYRKVCKEYTDNSLYLEIEAINKDGESYLHKIPLKITDNCNE